MRFLVGVTSILAFLLLAPGARAQESSLAGLAKKTKEERKDDKSGSKVIRAEDLRHTKSRVYVPPGTAPPAAAESGAAEGEQKAGDGETAAEGEDAEKSPEEQRAALAEQLQADIALQQDRVAKLREQIADAQTQLADQTTYYPGNPRRASLQELIDKCNVEIGDAEKTITEIRRRARSQGITLR